MTYVLSFSKKFARMNNSYFIICYFILLFTLLIALIFNFTDNVINKNKYQNITDSEKLDFILPSLLDSDNNINSKNLIGKKYLISFFSHNCKKCENNYKYFNKLSDFTIPSYGILIGDDSKLSFKSVKKLSEVYRDIAIDKEGYIADKFLLVGVPEMFLVNEKGNIVKIIKGVIDDETYRKEILTFFMK